MRQRTTAELIKTLGADIDRCHGGLVESIEAGDAEPDGGVYADYEYHARQLIRSIFAFIEAVTFSMKVKAAEYCVRHGRPISEAERFLATDVERTLSEKGELVERTAHIRLADNIRFAFALHEKALGIRKRFDPSVEWWSCLKSSIKVRDRLTHPKYPEDVDIAGDEIVNALKAYQGFNRQAMHYAGVRDRKKRRMGTGRTAVAKLAGRKSKRSSQGAPNSRPSRR